MVKGKFRKRRNGEPARLACVGCTCDHKPFRTDKCIVGNRNHPSPRIATRTSERKKLFEEHILDSGFFGQFADRRIFKRFTFMNEPTRYGPRTGKRLEVSF